MFDLVTFPCAILCPDKTGLTVPSMHVAMDSKLSVVNISLNNNYSM